MKKQKNNIDRNLDKLVSLVSETLGMMQETHQKGEWWIDETGGTQFADIELGDSGHEGIVIQALTNEILNHFGIDTDQDVGMLNEWEDNIKMVLMEDGKFDEEDEKIWNSKGPSEVILKKLVEDKVYSDPKQAEDAVYIAYGSTQTRDARDYAMKHWRWKIMKTFGGHIEIQTWNLKPDDLGTIVRGIWDIMDYEDSDDKEVGEDGYTGPRINVTVMSSGKRFHDIPLAVLEKKMPQNLHNYQSGVHVGYTENINEDYHHLHKEYRLYEGNRHIVAVFEDNSRLKFEVHFREKHGEDRDKWRRKAFTTWKSIANELHSDVQLTEVGNPVQKSWKECFQEALKDPKLKEFIRSKPHHRVFDDKGYPARVQGKPQPVIDPVNFTRMG